MTKPERAMLRSAPTVGRVYSVAYFGGIFALATLVAAWAAAVWGVVGFLLAAFWQALLTEVKKAAKPKAPADSIVLGDDESGEAAWLTNRQLAAHGLIVGASGSGKTTTLLKLLCEATVRGLPVVAIDLKGSRSFARQLFAATKLAQRPGALWRLEGPVHWNPLQYGDASELKDKLIAAERFTEPHYQRAAERYLQLAIQMLKLARPDRPVTLAAVTNVLDPDGLRRLLPHVPRELAQRVGPYLHNLTRDQKSAILGLQSRLALVSESTAGEFLQPGPPTESVDLHRALGGGKDVVLFSLDSSRHPKLAAQVAAMIVQDLVAVSGYRREEESWPLGLIAIDEFSAIDTDNLLALVTRCRDAGMSVLLSTQELADLDRLAAGFKDQVLGNTAVLVAHRQNVPDSAELIARMIGTSTVWKATQQVGPPTRLLDQVFGGMKPQPTGVGTIREVEEFRIHPNKIKELATGNAVLITKIPTATARIVRIDPWSAPQTER